LVVKVEAPPPPVVVLVELPQAVRDSAQSKAKRARFILLHSQYAGFTGKAHVARTAQPPRNSVNGGIDPGFISASEAELDFASTAVEAGGFHLNITKIIENPAGLGGLKEAV
jgi:hypothetical protein